MNGIIRVDVKINNLPDYDLKKFIVVRFVNHELWFYGTYDLEDLDRAEEALRILDNALLITRWVE